MLKFVAVITLLSGSLLSLPVNAIPINATTEDGRKVILNDNGTWKFAGPTPRQLDSINQVISAQRLKAQEDSLAQAGGSSGSDTADKHSTLVDILKNNKEFDFRKARWGMTVKEVKASEDADLVNEAPDRLTYKVNLFEYSCDVIYTFVDGKLTSATNAIEQPHVDPQIYYQDFESLKKYLEPIYGRPLSDGFTWKNDMYKDDKSKYGFAISIGFLTCREIWQNKTTQIILNITGQNHEFSTSITYSSTGIRK